MTTKETRIIFIRGDGCSGTVFPYLKKITELATRKEVEIVEDEEILRKGLKFTDNVIGYLGGLDNKKSFQLRKKLELILKAVPIRKFELNKTEKERPVLWLFRSNNFGFYYSSETLKKTGNSKEIELKTTIREQDVLDYFALIKKIFPLQYKNSTFLLKYVVFTEIRKLIDKLSIPMLHPDYGLEALLRWGETEGNYQNLITFDIEGDILTEFLLFIFKNSRIFSNSINIERNGRIWLYQTVHGPAVGLFKKRKCDKYIPVGEISAISDLLEKLGFVEEGRVLYVFTKEELLKRFKSKKEILSEFRSCESFLTALLERFISWRGK